MHNPPDSFIHLEELNKKNHRWVTKHSDSALKEFGGRGFKAREKAIAEILSAQDELPLGEKHGDWIYNFYTDGDHPRGLWRRTKATDYLTKAQHKITWETLLDVGKLGEQEDESWVFLGANLLYPGGERALITLSVGGSDSNVVREFDVENKRFLDDGFVKPESKGSMSWVNIDTVIIESDFGEGSLTESGYPRTARLWRRGENLADAPTIIEGEYTDVVAGASYDPTPGHEKLVAYRATDFRSAIAYDIEISQLENPDLKLDAKLFQSARREIQVPDTAGTDAVRDWLLVTLRHDWELGSETFVAGSVLILPYAATLEGPQASDVQILYTPTETSSLLDVASTATGVVLTILDNVKTRIFFAADPHVADDGGRWELVEVTPKVTEFASVAIGAVDPFESGDIWMIVSDFLTPSSLYHGHVSTKELKVRKVHAEPERFDTHGLEIRQLWATSKDGTNVPYFVVGPQDALNGSQPSRTLLDGYGGFEVSLLPSYVPAYGKVWLEEGAVYVVANIRGGGEFGPRWHQAALKENRRKAYEDFAAVAANLVERNITTRDQLAAIGGSNGGLLMGNMYTTYPELFGAIVCQVPLLDMKRYSHLLAGASWVAEYGDPDTDDWEFMAQYSAYHNVTDGPHPPILLTTSTRDDRVHPGHARKFHALLQDKGLESHLYENTEGGHAGAADIDQQARMNALVFSFLDKKLVK